MLLFCKNSDVNVSVSSKKSEIYRSIIKLKLGKKGNFEIIKISELKVIKVPVTIFI